MADELDRAQDEVEFQLAQALKRSRPRLEAMGYCLECEADLTDYPRGALFCGPECRDDFETRARMRQINGR